MTSTRMVVLTASGLADLDVVERQQWLGYREDPEPQYGGGGEDQHRRSDQLAGQAERQLAPDPSVHRSAPVDLGRGTLAGRPRWRFEFGVHDQPLVVVPARIAGREGEPRLARLVARSVGHRRDHGDRGRFDDFGALHGVDEVGRPGLHDDEVVWLDPVEVPPDGRGAVPGDREVADLTGERGLRVVPGRVGDVSRIDAFDDDPVLGQPRDVEAGDRVTGWR